MKKTVKVLNLAFFILMIAANMFVVVMPPGKLTVGEVSDKYPTLFTPAGFTFSIWAVIYFSLMLFVVYQFSQSADKVLRRIGVLFIFTCILNAAWLAAWTYEKLGLSFVIITILLLTLMALYVKLTSDRYGASVLFVRVPFSLYFAWICVAFIANFSVFLKYSDWSMFGFDEQIWMLVALVLVLAAVSAVVIIKHDLVFSLVIVWASTGILIRHVSELNRQYPAVIGLIVLIYVIIAVENIYNLYRAMSKRR